MYHFNFMSQNKQLLYSLIDILGEVNGIYSAHQSIGDLTYIF